MVLGIERLALGRERLDPDARQRRDHIRVDESDPGHERRGIVGAVARRGVRRVERPVEVVDRGQQLEREPCDAAVLRDRRVTDRALAVVLEVRLRPLRQVEILVGLVRLRGQRLQVDLLWLSAHVRRAVNVGFGLGFERRLGRRVNRCHVLARVSGSRGSMLVWVRGVVRGTWPA